MGNVKLKILLYILSLWLLFFSLFIMSWDSSFINKSMTYIFGSKEISLSLIGKMKTRNFVFLISVLFMFIGFFGVWFFYMITSSGWSGPEKVCDVTNENHEHLEFLTTYVMPLVFTDVNSKRTAINLMVMIIAIGAIYIRTNKFYSNPSLAIIGFKIYKSKIKGQGNKEYILICRGYVMDDAAITYIKLDESTLLVKV
ncbi:hypothetical protein NAS92_22625 [Pantoea brenneri]|uniref:anti-phage protein KwaA n=1 Tax=Pantoea TaxID=53335 RepID=UPI00068049FE|nr:MULTISPECIES: anti-phage protein KwaA [Pantoea]KNH33897.1 hypothetical protein ACS76_05610 [Pantoea vagans]MCQ5473239.1 hypothetical protein [Pantoea brenneri]